MSGTGSILTAGEREALLAIVRGRRAGALKVRRANALVAPGDGNGVRLVCRFLHPGPDTVRGWAAGCAGSAGRGSPRWIRRRIRNGRAS